MSGYLAHQVLTHIASLLSPLYALVLGTSPQLHSPLRTPITPQASDSAHGALLRPIHRS